jgi:hypothetical protein
MRANRHIDSYIVVNWLQTTNILVVNQNAVDMTASLMLVLTGIVKVSSSGMDRNSIYDQFVCRFWLTRFHLWCPLVASTYSIVLLSLERYVAIVHPVFYKVRLFLEDHFFESLLLLKR